jgi:hypothetical protein
MPGRDAYLDGLLVLPCLEATGEDPDTFLAHREEKCQRGAGLA